jgi:hypothetical protein
LRKIAGIDTPAVAAPLARTLSEDVLQAADWPDLSSSKKEACGDGRDKSRGSGGGDGSGDGGGGGDARSKDVMGNEDRPRIRSIHDLFDAFLACQPDETWQVMGSDLAKALRLQKGETVDDARYQRRVARGGLIGEWAKSKRRDGRVHFEVPANDTGLQSLTLGHAVELCYPYVSRLEMLDALRWLDGKAAEHLSYTKPRVLADKRAGDILMKVALVEKDMICTMFRVHATVEVKDKKYASVEELVQKDCLGLDYITRAGLTLHSMLSIEKFAALYLGSQITYHQRTDIDPSIRLMVDRRTFSIPGIDFPPEEAGKEMNERAMMLSFRRRVRLLTEHRIYD